MSAVMHMCHFASSEAKRHLDLVPFCQKLPCRIHFGIQIIGFDIRRHTDLFDLGHMLVLSGLFFFFGLLALRTDKEEIEHRIHHLLEDYAEIVQKDGKVENGDVAIIDFKGLKDGVAFDGGTAENYSLTIGSGTFIPGFEEAIIGMKKGEEKDIDLTFPEDYGAKELAGAKVVFKVKVNEIKERIVPELDKDFFLDLGMEGITNEKELRNQIEAEIKEQKEHENEHKYIDALLDKASSNMKVEIDDEIVDAEAERMYSEFMQRMSMQGINEEMYLQYAGTTKEDVVKQMNPEALRRVKNRYLLEAVIKEEKLSVSDKDAKKELKDMAVKYNMTEEEVEKAIGGLEMLKYDLTMRKAIRKSIR